MLLLAALLRARPGPMSLPDEMWRAVLWFVLRSHWRMWSSGPGVPRDEQRPKPASVAHRELNIVHERARACALATQPPCKRARLPAAGSCCAPGVARLGFEALFIKKRTREALRGCPGPELLAGCPLVRRTSARCFGTGLAPSNGVVAKVLGRCVCLYVCVCV